LTGVLVGAMLGAILGVALERLRVSLAEKQKRDDERRKETRRKEVITAKDRINRERLLTEVLIPFYRPEALNALNLHEHVVSLDGTLIHTGVVAREEWRNLGIRIGRDSGECTLVEKAGTVPSLSGQERREILRAFSDEGRVVVDRPIFRLVGLDTEQGRFGVKLALDTFHDYMCSTGALEGELYQALIDADFSPGEVLKDSERYLRLRHKFLLDANALMGFQSRMCAGGAHVLMAFRRPANSGNDYVFFARRRSTEVATGESVMTLIPMGYHQPTLLSTARHEVPLAMSVYRETYEELFGGTELEEEPKHVTPGWYLRKYHPLAWLLDHPTSFAIEIASFGVSLMPGNYEFAVLFAVHDPQFWAQFSEMIQLNWEVQDTETPLISTADPSQLAWLVKENTWVGSSLFALAECLPRLAEMDETNTVRLPPINTLLA
jgi:hypothetical protein